MEYFDSIYIYFGYIRYNIYNIYIFHKEFGFNNF